MPRLHYIATDSSDWTAARISAPTGIPGGLRKTDGNAADDAVVILPLDESRAVLVSKPDTAVRINGQPMPAGLRVLSDRDEIRVNHERFYFSSRDPLIVESRQGEAVACPRCSGMIEPGTPAVRCHCGAWFHQCDEQPCFTYGDTCPLCGGSSRLDADPWDPSQI